MLVQCTGRLEISVNNINFSSGKSLCYVRIKPNNNFMGAEVKAYLLFL